MAAGSAQVDRLPPGIRCKPSASLIVGYACGFLRAETEVASAVVVVVAEAEWVVPVELFAPYRRWYR